VSVDIIEKILYLQDQSDEPITLFISSSGGSVPAGISIYDVMQESTVKIRTICIGYTWSMATVLLAGGTQGERYATPNSRIMIHSVWAETSGDIGVVQRHIKDTIIQDEFITNAIIKHSNYTRRKVKKDMKNTKYMSAEEAITYGIIDKIGVK